MARPLSRAAVKTLVNMFTDSDVGELECLAEVIEGKGHGPFIESSGGQV